MAPTPERAVSVLETGSGSPDVGPRVAVLGVGRSGVATCAYLAERMAGGEPLEVAAFDESDDERARQGAERIAAMGLDVRLGVAEVPGSWDLAVASPGIPPRSPLIVSAERSAGEVISEIELAWRISRSPFVAVTGTNGKTTVTSLVEHLLMCAGVPAEAAGNIGSPAVSAAASAGPATVLVTEVSSFQLSRIRDFHPRVAVLLNLTEDHVDWHGSFEAYASDKARVFENLGPGDLAIVDVDDEGSRPWAARLEETGLRVCRIALRGRHDGGAWVDDDDMLVVDRPEGPVELLDRSRLPLWGSHNVSNALASAAAAMEMGASDEDVARGLGSFEPIPHRLQPVGQVGGIEYFDDSKATNPDAALKALSAFAGRGVVLLLGGRGKDLSLERLVEGVRASARAVVTFGEAGPAISEALRSAGVRVRETGSMRDAVPVAAGIAEEGDAVVLSPACASFDEFRDYAERGDVFAALVRGLGAEER